MAKPFIGIETLFDLLQFLQSDNREKFEKLRNFSQKGVNQS